MKKWEKLYNDMYNQRFSLFNGYGILVIDKPVFGLCFITSGIDVVIYIKHDLTYKQKLMTLAHEYGHLLQCGNNNTFIGYKGNCTYDESTANESAVKVLEHLGIDEESYYKFYDYALHKTLKNKAIKSKEIR